MKFRVLIFSLLAGSCALQAAFDYPAYSARNAALSNSYLAATGIHDGFMINPALSSQTGAFYASLNYSQLYNIKELQYANGLAVLPLAAFGLGVGVENFGGALYSENKITINSSKLFYNNSLAVGVSLGVYHLSAEGYGSSSTVGLSIGILYQVTPNLHIAGVVENFNQPSINGFGEELPQRIQAGLQFEPVSHLRTHLKIQKDSYFSPEVLLGVEYRLFTNFEVFSGYSTLVTSPSFGFSLNAAKVEASYAIQHHFDLGTTHFIGIAFNGGK